MSIANPPRGKAGSLPDSVPAVHAPTAGSTPAPDPLAGLRWGVHEVMVIAAAVIALDVFAGWSYLVSYFSYFRVPVDGLGVSAADVLTSGLRAMALPLVVLPVAVFAAAPARELRAAALAVAGFVALLAYLAFVTQSVSGPAILAQVAAAAAVAALVFAMRRGYGGSPMQRLIVAAVALLVFISIPVATGTLDAGQRASAKQTTLRIVTRDLVLPDGVAAGGAVTYSNYLLLRESDSRYWLLRIGDRYAYSIAKSAVLYIRY